MMKKFYGAVLLCLLFGSLPLTASEVTVEEDGEVENLLTNPSFETAGKSETAAANWDNAGYRPAVRNQEKAFSGKYSMKIVGDGQNYYGLRQLIPGSRLQGKTKLEVSACFYFEKDLKGHFFPIFFIVSADGKQFWPQSRARKGSDPREKWFKAGATLDLSKYKNIRHVEIYTLGWKYGKNFFSGTAYIDDFEAFAE